MDDQHLRLKLQWNIAFADLMISLGELGECVKKYNPSQPRAPRGTPDGGQWVAVGSGSGGSASRRRERELGKPKPVIEMAPKVPSIEIPTFEDDENSIEISEILFFGTKPPTIIRPIPLEQVIKPDWTVRTFPKDLSKPPGPGFEWRGNGRSPGGPKGNWYNPKTKEKLNPDLNHKPPIKPHIDYDAPDGSQYRIYPDNTIEPKVITVHIDEMA